MGATRTVDPTAIIPNRAQGYDHRAAMARGRTPFLGTPRGFSGQVRWSFDRRRSGEMGRRAGQRRAAETRDPRPATDAADAGPKGSAPSTYGFGWVIDTLHGHREIWHNGGISGFRCQMVRFVDDKLTVIVLTNSGDASPESIAQGVAGFYVPGLSSATEKAIPDTDPTLTATLRKIFADLAKGTGDPTLYTPEMWRLLQSGLLHDARLSGPWRPTNRRTPRNPRPPRRRLPHLPLPPDLPRRPS